MKSAVLSFAIIVSAVNFTSYFAQKNVLGAEAQAVLDYDLLYKEKKYWQEMIKNNPTYRDAYLELSDIERMLGNRDRAIKLVNDAQILDPNSEFIEDYKRQVLGAL